MKRDASTALPALSVRRPLLAFVLNLLIILSGVAAMLGVEVRELPDVDRPIVTVVAQLPGAAPETMDAEVTSVLEGAVARVSGVRDIRANSEENSTRIRVEFSPGSDLDTAAADVREAVNQVARRLPDRVENLFVTKSDNDAEAIITIALIAEGYRVDELTEIIERDIAPELLSVDGVASLRNFGARDTQMRVVIDPIKLNRFGLTVGDMAAALRQAPFDVPVGSFNSQDQQLIVRAEATAATPDMIEDVVVAGTTRIGDLADVILLPADAQNLLRLNGAPVVGVGVIRRAQSNTIEIANKVQQRVDLLNARLDNNVQLLIISNDAVFIETSVREVFTSLLITVAIVVLAIWLFLGSWKATLVPAAAIPIALIGTVAGIWALGFSINLLTLLALVLATGLIVDDAIVVLENIQRQQALGLKRRAAATIGTTQVFFAVIATTVVLVAVFVPLSFLPSTVGRLFREFGFVLALAVILSSFVALTIAPAIASKFNFRTESHTPTLLERFGNRLVSVYGRILKWCLAMPAITVLISLVIASGAVFAYGGLAQELVPSEDRGRVEIFARGPDGVGISYMERQADRMEAIVQPLIDEGSVETLFTRVGQWDPNLVVSTARLAPWGERKQSQQDIIRELSGPMADIPGARVFVFGPSSFGRRGGGTRGGTLDVALTGPDYQEIFIAARALSEAIETRSELLSRPDISYQPTQPQLSIRVDRRRASDLNVSLDEIALTLRAMVDGENVVDLNVFDRAIPIILESQTTSIESPSDLRNLFVRSTAGDLVPLSGLTSIVEEGVAAELERVEQRRAIEMQVDLAPGVTLAEAIVEFESLADEILPRGIGMLMSGDADTLNESSRDLLITYIFAFSIVLLVLIAQFESISSPVIVVLSVPFALAAAVYALMLSGISLNIYSQIGLVLLIGLMAKNGILLVEFADQLRSQGRSVRDAVYEAAMIRLRPISMTVISTVLGALPLVLSTGAGAEARQSIGWVVFGGLGLSAFFTLFLTPVLYLSIARLAAPRSAEADALEAELDAVIVERTISKGASE
ncbi:MAG: efflux RND transporter permease subunit [Pseudomonadota bacterium]